jgi:hypothetical protein
MKSKLFLLFFWMALLPLVILVQPSYAQQAGSLRMNLEPAEAVSAGAQWRVDSGPWQNSGATVVNLFAGQHLVEYRAINNWTNPGPIYVTISGGQVATQTGRYTLIASGFINCNFNPEEARNAGIRWRPRPSDPFSQWGSDASWKLPGETVGNVPPGNYYIEIQNIPGWGLVRVPQNQNVLPNRQTTFSLEFQRTSAAIQVTLEPLQARNLGGRWRVQGGDWRQSGEQTLVGYGSHVIEFNAVSGLVQPTPIQVVVTAENVNRLIPVRGIYSEQLGALQVILLPAEAVQAGAAWWIQGLGGRIGGQTVPLPVGEHLVEFRSVPGWIPEAQTATVRIRSGQTTQITQNYRPSSGSVSVTIEPAGARAAGAQWQVGISALLNSGGVLTGLSAGRHQVTFKEIPGWSRPETMQVEVRSDQSIQVTGTYTETGSLTVFINPPEAKELGAQWGVSLGGANESPWQDSGATVSNIRPGTQRLRFKSLNDARWTTPEAINVTIASGQTTRTIAVYQQKSGSLSALILPAELREAGGQWRIPNIGGGAWRNSGASLDVPPGQHTVEFKTVNGWLTPATQNVNVASLQNIQVRGEYRRETGSIQVTIQPEGPIRNGAKWKFTTEQNWHNSGESVSGLLPGQRQIEFYTAGSNWITPPNQTVNIVANQTATATGTYQGVSGALTITIEPIEAAQSGARWRFGNQRWRISGDTEPAVPAGPQQIELNTIPGWTAVPPPTINILPGQANRGTASFRRGTGSLMVSIQPAGAIQAGAQWRVDGGNWQNSGGTLPNVTAGTRNVQYKEIPGWTRPASESVVVNTGQTAALVKNYTQQPGSLQVSLQPPNVIAAGAMWQVDGKGWRGNNQIENSLTPGPRRIEFKEVTGWAKPVLDVNVVSGQLLQATGTYTQTTGRLQVTLQPMNVESLGAQWRMDGGPWQASRRDITNIPAGPHQVEYSDVAGWVKPPPSPVNINGGQSTQITGTYQRR